MRTNAGFGKNKSPARLPTIASHFPRPGTQWHQRISAFFLKNPLPAKGVFHFSGNSAGTWKVCTI
jgi:hypothetical protein